MFGARTISVDAPLILLLFAKIIFQPPFDRFPMARSIEALKSDRKIIRVDRLHISSYGIYRSLYIAMLWIRAFSGTPASLARKYIYVRRLHIFPYFSIFFLSSRSSLSFSISFFFSLSLFLSLFLSLPFLSLCLTWGQSLKARWSRAKKLVHIVQYRI